MSGDFRPTHYQPNLGVATTDELLAELAARMETTQNSINGRRLGHMCNEARLELSPGVLGYSTAPELRGRRPSPLNDLAERCLADSNFWFDMLVGDDAPIHMALGMAGEVGEAVEHVKKAHRNNSRPMIEQLDNEDFAFELVDVLIYLLNMTAVVGIDLDGALEAKRSHNVARWGSPT